MVLNILFIAMIIILFLILLLFTLRVEIELFFKNKKFNANLKIFKVIKINLKDKNKKEREEKLDFARISAILNRKNTEHVKYLLSKSDMEVYGTLIFGTSYPDKTALLYGFINSLLYTIEPVIQSTFKSFEREYKVYPDLKNKKLEYEVKIKIYLKIIHYIKYKLRSMKDAKKM